MKPQAAYRRWAATGMLIALLLLAPLYLDRFPYQMAVVTGGFFYAILASSWALLAGTAGQFSFAHMALVGIGAYTSGLLGRDLGVNPLVGTLLGTLMAGGVGLIIGLLCLRLRGAYLALFTIAFSEILRIVLLTEFLYTGGTNGLKLAPIYAGITARTEYYITLGLLLSSIALMYWLTNSRFGLFIRAMREDEDAAAAMGVDVVRYKVMVFVITSMIVGLAGSVFYHQIGIVTPNIMELLQMSLVIAMVVIGGIESLFGAAVGAVVSRVTLELLRQINIFGLHIEFGAWRYAAFGVVLVFALRFAQNGLIYPIVNRLFPRMARGETVIKRQRSDEGSSK
ncbi:MAG: branched-chain amino acid ABC transporter permease [Acidobacteriaceae bacterium]